MDKITALIKENFPGFQFLHFVGYCKPGKLWITKVNKKPIGHFNQPYVYKKIRALNATRISLIMQHFETGEKKYQEVILTKIPTI